MQSAEDRTAVKAYIKFSTHGVWHRSFTFFHQFWGSDKYPLLQLPNLQWWCVYIITDFIHEEINVTLSGRWYMNI